VKQKGPRQFVDSAAFRAAFASGKVPAVRAARAIEVKADEAGKLSFVMSTSDTDRMGDTIAQDGWDLAAYAKNPVLLWAHRYDQLPVGKVGKALVEDGKLIARDVEFASRELSAFGWSVGEMYRQKFLNAVSVGFQPTVLEWKEDDSGGIDFQKQELLELSAVPVPANANALQLAKSAGLLVPEWKRWAEDILDEDGHPLRAVALVYREAISPAQVQVPHPKAGDNPYDDGPIAEFVELTAALRENTAELRALNASFARVEKAGFSDRIAARALSLLKKS
jgi:HK97 family phage prohead protease